MRQFLNDIGRSDFYCRKVVLFIIILINFQLVFVSCQQPLSHDEKENVEFYYYPGKNVYYNLEKKVFFYSLNGGRSWDSVKNISGKEPTYLGEKIILYNADEGIYKDNVAHRKMYNGRLYNVMAQDTVSLVTAPEVTERKVQKKAVVLKSEPEEEKQVRGLRKFLNKIFGKHNNKKDEE